MEIYLRVYAKIENLKPITSLVLAIRRRIKMDQLDFSRTISKQTVRF